MSSLTTRGPREQSQQRDQSTGRTQQPSRPHHGNVPKGDTAAARTRGGHARPAEQARCAPRPRVGLPLSDTGTHTGAVTAHTRPSTKASVGPP